MTRAERVSYGFVVDELLSRQSVFVEHKEVCLRALQFVEEAVLHGVVHAEVPVLERRAVAEG